MTATVDVQKGRMMPTTQYVQSWVWDCNECGWRGVDLYSERQAIQEAEKHLSDAHPDLTNPTMGRGQGDHGTD